MPSTKEGIKKIALHNNRLENILISGGSLLVACGLLLFSLTFFPVIKQEIIYRVNFTTTVAQKKISPVSTEFGIVIPKIKANARIISNIDPFNEEEYQRALTIGVAQAQGSALPVQTGNTFIFAHSAGNWYFANQYNAVFYLLYKLTKGDVIEIYYKNTLYTYKVRELRTVEANEVGYLTSKTDGWKTLTLMTCWPPGTTLKRLLVIADISSQ